jgi:hypothetical protein
MTRKDLDQILTVLRNKTKRNFVFDWTATGYRLCEKTEDGGMKELSPRYGSREFGIWLSAFDAGFDAGYSVEWECQECGPRESWSTSLLEDNGTPTHCDVDMRLPTKIAGDD